MWLRFPISRRSEECGEVRSGAPSRDRIRRALTSPDNNASPKPVLLLVLDGIRPDVLRAAIREGDAPNLGALAERGEAVWDAVSVFPSITPAATAAIATGEAPAGSGIVGHAWYDEGERRVVVYGAMTETVMATGPIKVFHNNVWRMNRDDLYAATLFETLHDRGFDGACVNFPVRRGPHTHPIRMKTVEGYRRAGATSVPRSKARRNTSWATSSTAARRAATAARRAAASGGPSGSTTSTPPGSARCS